LRAGQFTPPGELITSPKPGPENSKTELVHGPLAL
jgi:hypothetical protein